ncbi:unnamed protein product [Leuciscus chuanchicus]
MYLYKATCPDIPTPKQKGLQKERGPSLCGKQNAGGKLYPPIVCLRSKSQVELKHLEEFLNVHTLSLQDSVRARTGMAYSGRFHPQMLQQRRFILGDSHYNVPELLRKLQTLL